MDKYAVETDPGATKVASESKEPTCPSCGSRLSQGANVPTCPRCGTKPFESEAAAKP